MDSKYGDQEKMILTWQKTRKKEDLTKIMKSLSPLITSEVNKWTLGGTLPRTAIDLRAKAMVLNALPRFDPKKAAVSTFVINQIKPISRTVYTAQNLAKIPESRVQKIGALKMAKETLENKLGREPNDQELSEFMGIPIRTVTLLNKEMWREAASTPLIDTMYQGKGDYHAKEALENLWFSSGDVEKLVLENLAGLHGKKKLSSMSEISKKTGLTLYQVRVARESLKKKIQERLGEWQKVI